MKPIFEYTDYREWIRDAFEDFKKRISEKERIAKNDGKEEIICVLQSTFESISKEEGVAVEKILNKIEQNKLSFFLLFALYAISFILFPKGRIHK